MLEQWYRKLHCVQTDVNYKNKEKIHLTYLLSTLLQSSLYLHWTYSMHIWLVQYFGQLAIHIYNVSTVLSKAILNRCWIQRSKLSKIKQSINCFMTLHMCGMQNDFTMHKRNHIIKLYLSLHVSDHEIFWNVMVYWWIWSLWHNTLLIQVL